MEKLLIIFPAWQQHHNIKENLKCTNFYSPSLNTSKNLIFKSISNIGGGQHGG